MLRTISSTSSVSRASSSMTSHPSRANGAIRTFIHSRKSSSSSSSLPSATNIKYHPVDIHPLSQMVLQYLQDCKSDWLIEKGLDRGLSINSDGTIKISFPPLSENSEGDKLYDNENVDGGRIWTSYDHIKKQHFISVHRHNVLLGRFMLRHINCNGYTTSLDCDESSPKEQVHVAVEQLIERVTALEKKNSATTTA